MRNKEIQLQEVSENDYNVWVELWKNHSLAKTYACQEYVKGANIIYPMLVEMPASHEIKLPNWEILPIQGKSSDAVFFERLSLGHFNVNTRLREKSRLAYQIEPDLWHDTVGHFPMLLHPFMARIARSMALAAVMSKDERFIKQVANLWWATFEFGGINEKSDLHPKGIVRPFGAGILSSKDETFHFMTEGKVSYREFNLAEILETDDYVTDGFQRDYWILESWDDLKSAIIELWSYLR